MDSPIESGTGPRKGLAVTSLILGIASYVLLLGPFTGIPAIITGHVALGRTRRKPTEFGGAGKAVTGMVLGYVSLLIGLPLMAVALGLAAPRFIESRDRARTERCTANLSQLLAAAQAYSRDHAHTFPVRIDQLSNSVSSADIVRCPADPSRKRTPGSTSNELRPDGISYDLLLPGTATAELKTQAVLRCPFHGTTVAADGTIRSGKVGPARKKRDRGP